MSKVFVVDTNKQPLTPVHPGWARLLLTQGKAAVYKRFPFTIMLKAEIDSPEMEPLRIKVDPGAKMTGLALVNDQSGEVVFAAELAHRGQAIKDVLESRRALRRSRRQCHTRYRKPRWQNRRRAKGWLPPSLHSRISNILTWVKRLTKLAPITAMSQELVKFDLQCMENPEISGSEYQQGALAGYDLREYLLQKWNRQCAYCGTKHLPLQVEHIQAKANGGTSRVSNLCLACEPCNRAKGTLDIRVFLAKKLDLLGRILAQAKAPLKDATAVNATRWALYERLKAIGLPIECGSGVSPNSIELAEVWKKAIGSMQPALDRVRQNSSRLREWWSFQLPPLGMAADRSVMLMRAVSLVQSPKAQRRSRASRQETWCEQWYQNATKRRGRTLVVS